MLLDINKFKKLNVKPGKKQGRNKKISEILPRIGVS